MSINKKDEQIESLRRLYKYATKVQKGFILNEICSTFELHRKSAIRLMNIKNTTPTQNSRKKRGPKPRYTNPLLDEVLTDIWRLTNLPCAKRLKAILSIWLPDYDKFIIPDEVREKLLSMSASTIDRIMSTSRTDYNKFGLSTTKPGTLIKKRIPVKTNQWDETQPGFLEADTVAHCGSSVAGMYVFTVNCVDIATGWTESRAVWGKGELGVKNALENIEQALPFDIKGFDCDNGSEFLNWHLIKHFTERKRPVQFTRSRPYKKNDNAHIENKNWTNTRQYLGYERFVDPQLTALINELYENQWSDYFNFFIPSVKLISKERIGSKIIRIHDKPKTPYQRCLESEYISQKIKHDLTEKRKKLNPFQVQKQMGRKIKSVMKILHQEKTTNVVT